MRQMVRAVLGMVAATAVIGMVATTSAEATPVTYYTTGCFNGCIPVVDDFAVSGSALLGFLTAGNAVTPLTVDAPSNISLGAITTAALAPGGNFAATPFNLFIIQTVPGAGAGQLIASINGNITPTSSGADLSFTTTSIVIAGIQYAISDNPLHLVAPTTFGGLTSIQANVTPVPEPATMMLLGTGLIGLVSRRRKTSGLVAA